jgi:hypothetical protein
MGFLSVLCFLAYIFANSHGTKNTFPFGTIGIVLLILGLVSGGIEGYLFHREPIRYKNPDFPDL